MIVCVDVFRMFSDYGIGEMIGIYKINEFEVYGDVVIVEIKFLYEKYFELTIYDIEDSEVFICRRSLFKI
jgi:hypothetical protein